MRTVRIASLTLLFAAAIAATASAQSKPNFSGTWIAADGGAETIVHDEKTISFTHGSEGGHHQFTYKLDGSESKNALSVHHDEKIVSTASARWEGSTLVIDESTVYPDGRKRQMKRTLTLNASGELEQSFTGQNPDGTRTERKSTSKKR